MTPLQKKVKEDLKRLKAVKTGDVYSPATVKFGDRYGHTDSYDAAEVAYLLSKFPPCKMYKHEDSCTAYYPTDKAKNKETVTEVNPVLLECDGLDSYIYTLTWFTEMNKVYWNIEVIIDYGSELVKITYKYNDSRQLPKFSGFKARPVAGLKAIVYYGDSGEHMTRFKCEVLNKRNKKFFIQ